MWTLGWQETMVIFLLALLLFGPKKLPELGKNIAKGLAEFRRASSDLKATFDKEMANIERETGSIKQDLEKHTSEFTNYDSYYENSYYDSGIDAAKNGSESGQGNTTVGASATEGAESKTVQASNGQNAAATTAEAESGTASVATADHAPEATPADEKPVARG